MDFFPDKEITWLENLISLFKETRKDLNLYRLF